jgi:hypothetical protein
MKSFARKLVGGEPDERVVSHFFCYLSPTLLVEPDHVRGIPVRWACLLGPT